MSKDWLRYDRMVEDALRGVVRRALSDVSATGLPGDHHFYLTFRTGEPGVQMAPALKSQYPKEMTIVLQHQFWGLEVGDDGFAVTLSFGGKHERLVVPYRSIVSFADPSVKFGLQFESTAHGEGEVAEPDIATGKTVMPKDLNDLPRLIEDKAGDAKSGAQVVALDAFRKK
ncbi:SspB family protein [Dongia deserti]|uniref:SspB family protein n=1 Tax=Dongia deserti TaxID=2268030 RepID=UPI000E64FBC8|nr:ClpXP protease specificity-enhancing factor SspB [Dongia deserti]